MGVARQGPLTRPLAPIKIAIRDGSFTSTFAVHPTWRVPMLGWFLSGRKGK